MTTLSIIIPTFNRKNLLNYTLQSLDTKLHPNVDMEVIVVDDGSTDGTAPFVTANYPGVKFLPSKAKGAAAARNTGLEIADGNYILYLDSDDLIGENYFAEKLKYLDQHPDVDAVYGAYDFFASDSEFNSDKIIFKHKYPQISAGDVRKHIINNLSGNFLPPNTIIWRKSLLTRLGGHDEMLAVNQDVELLIRALFFGLKLVAVPDQTKVYIRQHALDNRVGDASNAAEKWNQILELRKEIYKMLQQNGHGNSESYQALSNYLFGFWKSLRHKSPALANKYLETAKMISWPVHVKGNLIYRTLAKLVGPEKAVKIKYSLLKRD